MEQAKPQEAIIPSSVRAKAPRPAEMMTAIEVETDCSNLVIEGWTVPAGVCQVTAPVDMLKRVEAMVEKRHERIKQAEINLATRIQEDVAAGKKADTLPYSLQSEFRKLANPGEKQRDMLPLKRCVTVGDPFIRPADGAAQQEALAAGIGASVAKAVTDALFARDRDDDARIKKAVADALAAERASRKG